MSKSKLMSKPSFPNKNRAIRPSEIKHNTEKHDFNHQTSRILLRILFHLGHFSSRSRRSLFLRQRQLYLRTQLLLRAGPSAAIKAAVIISTSAASMPLMNASMQNPRKRSARKNPINKRKKPTNRAKTRTVKKPKNSSPCRLNKNKMLKCNASALPKS